MQQAILITAYRNIEHLYSIVSSFDTGNYVFFIHIDKKSKIDKLDIGRLSQLDNVKLVSQKYNVNWGGINHLKAILLLLEEAFKCEKVEYFHLITGHDFPIKSTEYITSFMEANRGKEFMDYDKLPYDRWGDGGMGGLDRLCLFNFYDVFDGRGGWGRSVIYKLRSLQLKVGFRRKFYSGFPDLYGGSTYWTLSRRCIEYVFSYMKANPKYLKRFRYSFCSEEIFFQTIVLNSPFKDSVVKNNLRFILWELRNGNFPANLDDSDFGSLIESKALFARKFEFPVSANLLERIKDYLKTNS